MVFQSKFKESKQTPSTVSGGGKESYENNKISAGSTPTKIRSSTQSKPPRTLTTKPDVLLRHDISDEQLDILTTNSIDRGAMWTCWGFVLGSVYPISGNIYFAYFSPNIIPMNGAELLHFGLGLICFGVATVLAMVTHRDKGKAHKLAHDIRQRERK